jgi:PAS domain S-box-containing protein
MAETPTKTLRTEQAGATAAAETQRPFVLLVDDQPARLLTYEAILEGVGVDCVRALSGTEALERLLRQTFAVIVLDVSMPEMDGFETARMIREHPKFERTPIIFVTGVHVTELDVLRGYEVGAIDYISVPIVPEILRSKVVLLVELFKRRRQLESLNRELEMTRAQLEAEQRRVVADGAARLREQGEQYRAIFEHPTELTVVVEAVRGDDGTIVNWRYRDANRNALAFFKRSREELLGRLVTEVLPERAARIAPVMTRVLSERAPYRYETEVADHHFLICLFPLGENAVVSTALDITARTRAEKETQRRFAADRAEKEWLAAVLGAMNEEVYFTDTQKRYTYANPAALREFGHREIEGVDVEQLVSGLEVLRPDGTPRPIEEAPPLRALAGEVVRDEEQIVRTPRTGELRHRQVSSAPVRDGQGEIIGSVSVVRDVTEQKRVEAAARARDARSTALLKLADVFRTLTEPADLAFAAAQMLGETLGVSRCGYGTIDPVAETITIERDWNAPGVNSLAGVLHFRDYGTYIDDLKRGETVVLADAELDARTAATAENLKALCARSLVNMPITEPSGTVALLYLNHADARNWTEDELSFIREVAERTRIAVERRRSERALATELQHTRLLRELAARVVAESELPVIFDEILATAMTITHADCGTIQLLDEAAQELYFAATRGFDPHMTDHFARVSAKSHTPCGVALARGARVFIDFDGQAEGDPDGSLRMHSDYGLRSAQSTPLVSRAGRALGMLSTHWREPRRLDERELRFLDLLARQIADLIERTQAERALRQSEQQLRETDRRKDEFIAVLAHELRNPLVPIRTGVELLKHAREQPATIDTIRPMMERQIGHMVRLIDDLLDVSRITSGKIELQPRAVTLASIVSSAIEANRAAISGAELELAVNLSDPLWVLYVDPTRFVQVLANLLQNAAKFTAPGGRIAITATIERADPASTPELILKVSDSGIGIAPEILPRVFDLFVQSEKARHGKQSGLGIGLALARRLVEMHGGTIEARSAGEGRGSEFTIRVPAPPREEVEEEQRSAESRSLRGVHVLVIDDNHDAADAMVMLIQGFGGTTHVAYDGAFGLAALQEFRADVVLLDIGMPGMNGYDTCRRIRERFGNRVAIVALTGWGQELHKRLAHEAGFDAHLTKPADPARLEEVVRTLSARTVG